MDGYDHGKPHIPGICRTEDVHRQGCFTLIHIGNIQIFLHIIVVYIFRPFQGDLFFRIESALEACHNRADQFILEGSSETACILFFTHHKPLLITCSGPDLYLFILQAGLT